ncbi:MAG: hypothetical protein LBF33_02655, partial [Oscillospiraceae bacterium]|nr:hypothetical protein [Oscillospiraceae bacterium]
MKHTEVSNFLNFLTKNPNKISEFEKLRNKYPKGKLDEKKSEEFLSQDLIPFAKENGFNFTKEEYKKFTEKVYDENKQE